MIAEFRLPDLGEGLTEAEVVQWLVAPGDSVALNQTLAEVETAKAVVELPSPYEGTVSTLHADAGETVAVGAPLIAFDIEGDDPPAAPSGGEQESSAEKAQPNLVGYGAAPTSSGRPARRARRRSAAPVASAADTAVLEAAPHDATPSVAVEPVLERPRSTPPVRAYAKRRGVDLVLVAAEVGDRVITRADVDAYAERIGAEPSRPAGTPERETTAASGTLPRAEGRPRETRIPIRGVVAKAVCLALRRAPGLNARWDEESGEIVEYGFVDLGIAAATERGLIVPMIRDAERMNLVELSAAIRALAETARAGKTSPAELAGGTFSLSNIGVFGVDAGTPILPPGQSGILAVGAVRRQPWEYRGEIALRQLMTLSLSFDHRLVDGAEGATFLKDVADILEDPGRAMLLS